MRPAWIAPLLAAGVCACGSGGDDDRPPPPQVKRAEIAVIRGWADALRAGRVSEASRYFAVPALVSNPAPVFRLLSRDAVRRFNRALPCGAELVGTERGTGALVIATFRLTERPGPGSCGTGTGALARTAFLIRRGRIVQWLRVADPAAPPADARES
ncbi:MAG: hypothetical protein ACRDPC_16430 [Solirubrobacteraceae bacterium]